MSLAGYIAGPRSWRRMPMRKARVPPKRQARNLAGAG
eukprot:CAMPEP_0181224096 /NCGR_PEP_ID=MMETSP1096-20121128/30925_1 /TAXON_ID=156174 ORGANISM="Chrysochromulina ericina, Strain CCMP281" /NCGR_SAMPLE_ID=MMETSP1096 /ASSEMBLY_ACC=CAM_ASM_000453 /LENGTH=36 /DNA_ID= /DNA_START= /DNA_END= /DNA_ORIENTATION=